MATDAKSASTPVYKLKRIDFFGRAVPIALQNENGPCPLLAIANVLLLRKQIELPEHAPDVSQNRLVSLVAGYLLDANDEQKLSKSLPEEYKANLRKNVSDAIAILGKLTTGIDVNVRFHDIKGFEFTDEISIFDLMDISLVHGWLLDPQDSIAASALGQKSYNEAVEQLILLLGDATPKRLLTPQLSRHTSGLSTPRRSTSSVTAIAATAGAPSSHVTPKTAAQPSQAPPPPPATSQADQQSHTTSGAPSASVWASDAATDDTDAPVSSATAAMDAALVTPMGAITSQDTSSQGIHDAASFEGPSGSLVSVQPTAAQSFAYGELSTTDEEQLQSASYLQPPKQQHAPLTSPAAEFDVQQQQHDMSTLSLPSADDITPQNSSSRVDAHIAAAPTPYPSLASGWSQPNSPKTPQTGAGQMTALSRALERAVGAQPGSPAQKSPLADSAVTASSTSSAAQIGTDSKAPFEETSVAAVPPSAEKALPTGAGAFTAASDALGATGQQPTTASDFSAAHAAAPRETEARPAGAEAAALKLDDADSAQLQAALAMSLDKDTAEQLADEFAGASITTGNVSAQDTSGKQSGHAGPAASAATGSGSNDVPTQPPQQQQQGHHPEASPRPEAPNIPELRSEAVPGVSETVHKQHPDASSSSHAADQTASGGQPTGQGHLTEHKLSLLTHSDTGTADTASLVKATFPTAKGEPALSGSQPAAQQHGSSDMAQQSGTGSRRSTGEGEQQSKNAAEAHIIQDFLDSTSSQLTEHGLCSLQQGLRPNELAVFFRNNHFNTLFLHKGVLRILVTDQGYEYEKNVVWERLDNVMGNTQFLKADFQPYGASSLAEQVSDAADLMQAAFAGLSPSKSSAAQEGGGVDADYALAMQLQEEEQRQASQHQQARQQPQSGTRSRPQSAAARSDPRSRDAHSRPPSGRHSAQSFANPMMQQQGARRQAPAQPQQAEKTTSTIAKWFGWGKK